MGLFLSDKMFDSELQIVYSTAQSAKHGSNPKSVSLSFKRHGGNIVFFLENPEIMRLIDWGNLLVDNSNLDPSSARNFSNKFANNAPSNSAPSSAPNFHHNSSSLTTRTGSNHLIEIKPGTF